MDATEANLIAEIERAEPADDWVEDYFSSRPSSIPNSTYLQSDGLVFVMVPLDVIRFGNGSSPRWRVATVLLAEWADHGGEYPDWHDD